MASGIIWAAKRFLTKKRVNQTEAQRVAAFKALNARIDARTQQASREWETLFDAGACKDANPIARSFHAYVTVMMDDLQQKRRHPEHDRSIKEGAKIAAEIRRLRSAAGLPKNEPLDTSNEPPPSPELAAARVALEEVNAESKRTSTLPKPPVTTEDLKTATYETKCLYGWMAHVLPETEYEDFFMDVWQRFNPGMPQVKNATHAFETARALRSFPRLQSALDRWPELPFSYAEPTREDLLRAEWKAAKPLVRDSDPIETIEAVFATFSADDLHEIAHGHDLGSAPFIRAVARHPLCDWASALEILHSSSAAAYQGDWTLGKPESDFDENEEMLFEAFALIAQRANGIGFRSRSFKTNYAFGPVMSGGKPDPSHPQNWAKWAIPESNMMRPEGKQNAPSILFDATEIRPTFETWKQKMA